MSEERVRLSVKLVVTKVTETGLTVKVPCIVTQIILQCNILHLPVASCHSREQFGNCLHTAQFGPPLGQSRALTICNTNACTHDVASSKFVYVQCIPDDARITVSIATHSKVLRNWVHFPSAVAFRLAF